MDRAWLELPGFRGLLLRLGLLTTLQAGAVMLQALGLAAAVATLFHGGTGAEAALGLALFGGGWCVRHTLIWLERRTADRFAERTAEALRVRLTETFFHMGPVAAAREGSGRLVTLAMDGIDRVRVYLELAIPRVIGMAVGTTLLIAAVAWLDAVSALILAVSLPVLIAFFILMGLAARRQADRQWQSHRLLAHHFTDALRGLRTLRELGRSRAHGRTVEAVSEQHRGATMRLLRVAFLSSFTLDFFSMLAVAFVAVGLGLRLIDGAIGLERALAVLVLAPEVFVPVRMLGTDYHASLDGKEAWADARRILDERRRPGGGASDQDGRPGVPLSDEREGETPASASPVGADACGVRARSPIRPFVVPPARVDRGVLPDLPSLHDVGVDGEDGPRLTGIRAELPPQALRIGIVGASGSGKSTLLDVLSGFVRPDRGELRLDGRTPGISEVESWQRRIAYIPQQPYLFARTLADNVRFYAPEAQDEEVRAAIEAANLGPLLRQLPDGLEARIGEGGRALSGGQAQRVALARALVGGRSTVLLDEPTAHLDIETEWELKATILQALHGKRMFIATHRLHWMADMDWVWVMERGRLVEAGTPAQLLERRGRYYSMLTNREEEGRDDIHIDRQAR
ncbi:thiol reductant ABC exporter subunit CydD [Paenibacillus sp. IB182496]|uniref:Thiol reductant ABC exporter subunit CydD n=1 Tax=Paenibacillus sabuli TaxID=2772509 RepID=A0A927BTH2_9BACL|nr:thiol reductant ABC exporter subunit CydD [Paenibacillus sabuli]MBD2845380.1 thiol reductant ABC exporter subunit CydD [Paenibacillus sabuli]